jgi:DNA-directed RNA polymerase subunit K/omega
MGCRFVDGSQGQKRMRQESIEALLAKVGPRFAVVNVLAARAEQLIRGGVPAIETCTRNPVLVAMEELALGKLHLIAKRPSESPPHEVESNALAVRRTQPR